jgi:hypothetical protein
VGQRHAASALCRLEKYEIYHREKSLKINKNLKMIGLSHEMHFFGMASTIISGFSICAPMVLKILDFLVEEKKMNMKIFLPTE